MHINYGSIITLLAPYLNDRAKARESANSILEGICGHPLDTQYSPPHPFVHKYGDHRSAVAYASAAAITIELEFYRAFMGEVEAEIQKRNQEILKLRSTLTQAANELLSITDHMQCEYGENPAMRVPGIDGDPSKELDDAVLAEINEGDIEGVSLQGVLDLAKRLNNVLANTDGLLGQTSSNPCETAVDVALDEDFGDDEPPAPKAIKPVKPIKAKPAKKKPQ